LHVQAATLAARPARRTGASLSQALEEIGDSFVDTDGDLLQELADSDTIQAATPPARPVSRTGALKPIAALGTVIPATRSQIRNAKAVKE
jgi:hypothetical protein